MTKEEAKEILRYNSNVIHQTINGETDPNEVEALDMAIKALTQEPILDKIKSEIEELDNKLCRQFLIEDIDREVHRTYRECIDIIDKYKAESEDKNEFSSDK